MTLCKVFIKLLPPLGVSRYRGVSHVSLRAHRVLSAGSGRLYGFPLYGKKGGRILVRGALAFLASVACRNDQAVYTDLGQSMTYMRSGLDRLSHVGVSRSRPRAPSVVGTHTVPDYNLLEDL